MPAAICSSYIPNIGSIPTALDLSGINSQMVAVKKMTQGSNIIPIDSGHQDLPMLSS